MIKGSAGAGTVAAVLMMLRLAGATNGVDNLRFNEVTFLVSHNSHANFDAAGNDFMMRLGSNQRDSILDQLNNGVQGISLDIELDYSQVDPDERLRLVHGPIDYGDLGSEMSRNVAPYLELNEDAIVIIYFQTNGDENDEQIRSDIFALLKQVFDKVLVGGEPLKNLTFKYGDERWDSNDWPTILELREANQRLFVFTDRSEFADHPDYGFIHNRAALMENDWRGIQGCMDRYNFGVPNVSFPDRRWSRLYFMNHFCCETGGESLTNIEGNNLLGGGDNGWGRLWRRVQQCKQNNGDFNPNFISLDWVHVITEALELRDFLNKVRDRIGTGQFCQANSNCATNSCSDSGVCQCELSSGVGCSFEETCLRAEPNVCSVVSETDLVEETEEDIQSIEATFYCSSDYETAVSGCNEATKCPNGNDDCRNGETCFAGIDCTPYPTLTPTSKPSDSPSTEPSTSPPTQDPTMENMPSTEPSKTNYNFCGRDFFEAETNCETALKCQEPLGNDICQNSLGAEYTCFGNIVCKKAPPPTVSPTIAPTAVKLDFSNITPTKTIAPSSNPTTGSPIRDPTLSEPTVPPTSHLKWQDPTIESGIQPGQPSLVSGGNDRVPGAIASDSPPSGEYDTGDTPSISQGTTLPPWESWYNDPDRYNSAASRTGCLLLVTVLYVLGSIRQ